MPTTRGRMIDIEQDDQVLQRVTHEDTTPEQVTEQALIKIHFWFKVNDKVLIEWGKSQQWSRQWQENVITSKVGQGNCVTRIYIDGMSCHPYVYQ